MPPEPAPAATQEAARITLMAHQDDAGQVLTTLAALGLTSVLVEPARCVRQWVHGRFWRLVGRETTLHANPIDIYRLTVARSSATGLVGWLATALGLGTPGRGAVCAQDVAVTDCSELPANVQIPPTSPPAGAAPEPTTPPAGGPMRDLTLLTAIQSMTGSGDQLARVALQLGAGVPVVSLGIGTGIRDRLGLLRITIPPEKELVSLMVPTHDAHGLRALLIEEGHLDRPGGGFVYQTPIRVGIVDPMIRIGRQEHAASIEQIIAAVDELKQGTAWRKRFFPNQPGSARQTIAARGFRELTFICADGASDALVQAAMDAGAPGATVARVRRLQLHGEPASGTAARERGVICVEADREPAVTTALCTAAADRDWTLQVLEATAVFAHQRH